jgi:hypothetical protein
MNRPRLQLLSATKKTFATAHQIAPSFRLFLFVTFSSSSTADTVRIMYNANLACICIATLQLKPTMTTGLVFSQAPMLYHAAITTRVPPRKQTQQTTTIERRKGFLHVLRCFAYRLTVGAAFILSLYLGFSAPLLQNLFNGASHHAGPSTVYIPVSRRTNNGISQPMSKKFN